MNKKVENIFREVFSFIKCLSVAFIFITVLYSQVFALTTVKQSSMENTLLDGEVLLLDKISYDFSEPKRGDIVVFLMNEESASLLNRFNIFFNDIGSKLSGKYRSDRLIKRVIGVSGDEINIHNGNLYINGIKQDELYVKSTTANGKIKMPITVPAGYVFVMGDNRMVSRDSRSFGLINIKNIEGKILLRALPISKLGKP